MSSTVHTVPVRGKARVIAKELRDRILRNLYGPGCRLPTFDELVQEFDVSRSTMQATIRKLKDEGFVRSVDRSGLYVSEKPPHLHRFGLLFPASTGKPDWNLFMAALLAEAPAVARQWIGTEIVPFLDLAEGTSDGSRDALLADLEVHRLAGLVVTRGTAFMLEHPLVTESRVPCVALNHLPDETSGAPVVNTDERLFFRKALAWLADRGRERVAVMAMREHIGVSEQDCRSAGLHTRPHWLCPVGGEFAGQARAIIQLLLDHPPQQRPDALIIATDHLVSEALGAIHEAGVVIGRDIDIVAHCNWPWPVESELPVARLGYHSHDFLRTSLELLRQLRDDKLPPARTTIPALFEHEL